MNTGYYSPEDLAKHMNEQRNQILTAHGTKHNISALESYYLSKIDNISSITPCDTYTNYYTPSYMPDKYEYNAAYNENDNFTLANAHASIASIRTSESNVTENVSGDAGNQFGQRSRNVQGQTRGSETNRFIGMFRSSFHHNVRPCQEPNCVEISQVHSSFEEENEISYLELDSHADTSLVGANCYVIAYTDKVCEVTPYHPKYKAIQNVPTLKAGTAYVDQDIGITYILIVNQALYLGDT
jgi:hypothetical protein